MERVIKFKVWNPVYGMAEPRTLREMTTFKPKDDGKRIASVSYPEDSIFLQYTGLVDSRGKEIYEGDIMSLGTKFRYVVKFEDAKFVAYHTLEQYGKWGDLHRAFDHDFREYGFYVIGNIYENKDLLPC